MIHILIGVAFRNVYYARAPDTRVEVPLESILLVNIQTITSRIGDRIHDESLSSFIRPIFG